MGTPPLCECLPLPFGKEVILNLMVLESHFYKGIPNVCPDLFARLLWLVVFHSGFVPIFSGDLLGENLPR